MMEFDPDDLRDLADAEWKKIKAHPEAREDTATGLYIFNGVCKTHGIEVALGVVARLSFLGIMATTDDENIRAFLFAHALDGVEDPKPEVLQ